MKHSASRKRRPTRPLGRSVNALTALVMITVPVILPGPSAAASRRSAAWPATASEPVLPVDPSPTFNQVWSMAEHNSYYFAPPDFEPYGSGLRAYHFANPNHDPVIIRLEAKGTFLDGNGSSCPGPSFTLIPFSFFPGCLFGDGMTPEYLDETLTKYLHDGRAGISTPPTFPPDDWVFGPKDYYQWCQGRLPQLVGAGKLPAGTALDPDNLKDAVRKCGWPTLRELQGKFVVNLFGSDQSGLTLNARSVNVYSHGHGRKIADAKIFPEASVVGSSIIANGNIDLGKINFLSPPSCPTGVCDWNDHTVFAEISGDLQSSDFACLQDPSAQSYFPCNGSQLADPGLTMQNYINDGGIVKSDDGKS